MKAETATKLLNDLVMAAIQHTTMKYAWKMLDAKHQRPDEASMATMAEIELHAMVTAKSTVEILLTELLGREPTQSEIDSVTTIAVDSPKRDGDDWQMPMSLN